MVRGWTTTVSQSLSKMRPRFDALDDPGSAWLPPSGLVPRRPGARVALHLALCGVRNDESNLSIWWHAGRGRCRIVVRAATLGSGSGGSRSRGPGSGQGARRQDGEVRAADLAAQPPGHQAAPRRGGHAPRHDATTSVRGSEIWYAASAWRRHHAHVPGRGTAAIDARARDEGLQDHEVLRRQEHRPDQG